METITKNTLCTVNYKIYYTTKYLNQKRDALFIFYNTKKEI